MTKEELLLEWENFKKDTYSFPLQPDTVERYIRGEDIEFKVNPTTYYMWYPKSITAELGGEAHETAKRILKVISMIKQDILSSYYLQIELPIIAQLDYPLSEVMGATAKLVKNAFLDNVVTGLSKAIKYYSREEIEKSLIPLKIKNDITEKSQYNHDLKLVMSIVALELVMEDKEKYDEYIKYIIECAEKDGKEIGAYLLGKLFDISSEGKLSLVKMMEASTMFTFYLYRIKLKGKFEQLKKFCKENGVYPTVVPKLVVNKLMDGHNVDNKGNARYFKELYREDKKTFLEVYSELEKEKSKRIFFLLAVMHSFGEGEEELERVEKNLMRIVYRSEKGNSAEIEKAFEKYLAGDIDEEKMLNTFTKGVIIKNEDIFEGLGCLYDWSEKVKIFLNLQFKNEDMTYVKAKPYNSFLKGRREWLDISTLESTKLLLENGYSFKNVLRIYADNGENASWLGEINLSNILELLKNYEKEAQELLEEKMDIYSYVRLIEALFDKGEMPEASWEFLVKTITGDKSKLIQKKAEELITKNSDRARKFVEEALPKAKGNTLQMYNRIIKYWDNEFLFKDGFKFTKEEAEEFCKNNYIKENEKLISWIPENFFEGVEYVDKNGTASKEMIKFLLLEYMSLASPYRVKSVDKIVEILDLRSLQSVLENIYQLWLENGADTKQKAVMLPYCIYGTDSQLIALRKQLEKWAEASRGALAAYVIPAIALNGGSVALMMVDSISGKFPNNQVKKAAKSAFAFVSAALGISEDALSDKIVPDFGFNREGKKFLDFGNRTFTITMTPDFSLSIYDDEKGKIVKSLPKPTAADDPVKAETAKKELAELKKQLKTTVQTQILRLKKVMMNGRCWKMEDWNRLFVENPVMHKFAIGLIWGVYEDGKLMESFRYMEDGTFNTADEEEYTLPEKAQITLVHPVELAEEELKQWKEQLDDYEITQPFDQLGSKSLTLKSEDVNDKVVVRYEGKVTTAGKLSGAIKKYDFVRGPIWDAGGFSCYFMVDKFLGLYVHIGGDMMYVGQAHDESVTLEKVTFCRLNENGEPDEEIKENVILNPNELPKRFVSSVLAIMEELVI